MNQPDSHVFKDTRLQQEFDERGFVRLQILNSDEVKRLLNEYQSLPRPRETGFHCTMFSPDSDLRKKADRIIKDFLVEKLSHIFLNYKPLYGNFMVKEPGMESDWFVHQDWSYVDESKYASVAAWVPLVDLTLENGVICVVPSSHEVKNLVRGPGVHDPWETVHGDIKQVSHEKVFLKAGEAIIWHHRLVHFSPPNVSKAARVAATLIYTPADVPVYHYWKNPSEEGTIVQKYRVDSDFYMNYDIVNRPVNVTLLGNEESYFPDINQNQLKSFSGLSDEAKLLNNYK